MSDGESFLDHMEALRRLTEHVRQQSAAEAEESHQRSEEMDRALVAACVEREAGASSAGMWAAVEQALGRK